MSMKHPVKVAIVGAAGRMGRHLCALADQAEDMSLVAAVDVAGTGQKVAGDVAITSSYEGGADVLIDFSLPQATSATIERCVAHGTALVLGTTGLTDEHQRQLDEAAKSVGVIQAANFSLVVNVLNRLAAEAAQLLGDDYDIEITETHHRFKKDAPSGTAIALAQHICHATDRDFDSDVVFSRHGDDAVRQPRQISVQALRLGDVVGEHTVHYATLGERLELTHRGTSRESYAGGAILAARWLVNQPVGRYTMANVLGLD